MTASELPNIASVLYFLYSRCFFLKIFAQFERRQSQKHRQITTCFNHHSLENINQIYQVIMSKEVQYKRGNGTNNSDEKISTYKNNVCCTGYFEVKGERVHQRCHGPTEISQKCALRRI